MKNIHLIDSVTLTIPDNWEMENHKNIISLFDPISGVGTLEFSFYSVPNNHSINLINELREYLSDKYEDVKISLVDGLVYSDIIYNNTYWKYWLLKTNEGVAFISYNCKREDIGIADATIDRIIKTA